ncbi:MAG: hypothetical protein FWB72_04605 [Firmicutes bacterium]|nr:hypothetical protein [Bacillota bacterium]
MESQEFLHCPCYVKDGQVRDGIWDMFTDMCRHINCYDFYAFRKGEDGFDATLKKYKCDRPDFDRNCPNHSWAASLFGRKVECDNLSKLRK